jgi:cytochrome b561
MTNRSATNLWDELTNTLYAWHKLIGFVIVLTTVVRIFLKFRSKKPSYPVNLSSGQIQLARLVQITLYSLLVLVPLFGWAGVTAFPALITVGGFHLPRMPGIPEDQTLAKQLFEIHGSLVLVLIAITLGHIAAGLTHLWFKKDLVFSRIWFGGKPD